MINSVAQYFPSADYLVEVMRAAVHATRPGGRLFVGDVRSLPVLSAFHAAVCVARAGDDAAPARLLQRARRAVDRDQEL